MVGNGTVATFQKIRTEYLHPVVPPPLGSPIREPNLSKYVYACVQIQSVNRKKERWIGDTFDEIDN